MLVHVLLTLTMYLEPFLVCSYRAPKIWVLSSDHPVKTIKAGATKDHGVFCIGDFQQYLNKVLLPAWEVPKSTLPYRARYVDSI